ncbi:DNA-binding IclR family transcriptional regulator [Microbacterium terrae]|uniref:Acetate operon repressor n=1 Tax=Microbacterium terrae TaxID=69369 RepID=A0A0M2H487_9MICO|nr:IclR family transcriptional regulator [Microbacterium terrae]KJL38671.1 Acetate operon repressor [Microbacterium terrae]MBP1076090.1 DNA-binding IclR family transcriptional regulator [Microbacterium terrae]GLJ96910.1 IclR family transcriptional regulator [Microbacterium terrae]
MRSAPQGEPVSVLDRILAILEAVRESHGTTTITQVAVITGIPKSTVSRLVGDLVRRRYLSRSAGGVAIGLRLFELGARASTPRRLSAAALPVLAELFNATGEHLNVAVQEGCDMLSVVSVRGRLRPVPSRAGVRVPSATTALGKAVLAFTEDDLVLRGVIGEFDPGTRHSYEKELAGVRAGWVAIDRCETFPGVVGVASPVLSPDRIPVAAISVAGPVTDMDPRRVAPFVRHAALALTHRLALQVA